MAIISIQIGQTGVVGPMPQWVYIATDDTIATVTTAGYLNGAAHEFVSMLSPNMMALVSTKTAKSVNVAPVLYTLQVQNSAGVWSLVAPAVDVPVPFIVLGNIQAGASGTAGEFISYPGTAANGNFQFKAINNSNNFNSILSNTAVGQATTYSLPDPGAATANIILSKSGSAQTIAGGLTITTGNFAVSQGNVTAGSSGHAGTIASFPGTAAKGSLILAAVDNTGNTNTTISNAAMGQASVISIPDPAGATANFVLAPSALVSGNFIKASGTAGLVVDGGAALHAGTTSAYAGGGTSHAFTATGMASSWIVTASILSQSNAASIVSAIPSSNTLTITFSADPGANTVINWTAVTAAI